MTGERNWYEYRTLSQEEKQDIVDAITKTCVEVPSEQQPFWNHRPITYRQGFGLACIAPRAWVWT